MTSRGISSAFVAVAVCGLVVAGRGFIAPSAPRLVGQPAVALRGTAQMHASVARFDSVAPATGLSCTAALGLLLAAAFAGGFAARNGTPGRRSVVVCQANLVATRPDQVIPWWERRAKPKVEEGIGIWAEKLNMTQIWQKHGENFKLTPATILCVKQGGNIVTDKMWPEKHGYYAVQVGYDRYEPPAEHMKGGWGGRFGAFKKNGLPPLKKVREFRVRPQDWDKYEIGQKLIPSELFRPGFPVHVVGVSKDKGYQGAIRKWGHQRGPMTHGSKHHRRYGSVGPGTTPGRVLPGKKMPGWMGGRSNTAKTRILKMIDRINEDNMPETIIVVAGGVAGYSAYGEKGGSYVWLCADKRIEMSKGRFKRDPVWLWYTHKGENVDQLVPMKGWAWAWKTFWGRDTRWIFGEVRKYWPDGFPGYDHSFDPFYDGCDPHAAIKAPEW